MGKDRHINNCKEARRKSKKMADSSSETPGTVEQTRQSQARGIIEDVFRRADKNDDGSLSLEEFQNFFADGILTNKELEALFVKIDTHKTNNLDTSELCEYFSKFWGPFDKVFAHLDDLGTSITQAMTITAQKYSEQSHIEQFSTRFLLKETLTHMSHLQQPLESAIDKLEEEKPMEEAPPSSLAAGKTVAVPRWQQRLLRSRSSTSGDGTTGVVSSYVGGEVERLAQLIDKLENKVKLDLVEEEEVPQGKENTVTVVSRVLETSEENAKDFRQALRLYTERTQAQTGALHVTVRVYAGTHRFTIYEVWQDAESLQSHYGSKVSKEFRHACIDQLVAPEESRSISLPASWWPMD